MTKKLLIVTGAVSLLVLAALVWGRFSGDDGQPESGAALAAVTVPDLAGTALEGEALFNDKCAACHGKNAAGRNGFGPPLVHKIYQPGHHADGAFHVAAMRGTRAHHWPFGDMPPVENVTVQDVDKIVVYVRALQRANDIN